MTEELKLIDVQSILKKIQRLIPYGGDSSNSLQYGKDEHKNDDEEDDDDILVKEFRRFDKDHDNMINFEEFCEGIKKYDPELLKEELEKLFEYFDREKNKNISYHYFVQILMQDHMNFAKIRKRLTRYLDNNNINL